MSICFIAFVAIFQCYGKYSCGVHVPMMLLKSCKSMHAPITQDPPPMTEDMHEERLQAAQALGDLFLISRSFQPLSARYGQVSGELRRIMEMHELAIAEFAKDLFKTMRKPCKHVTRPPRYGCRFQHLKEVK